MEDIQGMLARYKAEGASSETLEEVCVFSVGGMLKPASTD